MPETKKIAILVKNLTSGGAEKQAVLLARSLSRHFDTYFLIFNEGNTHQKYLDLLSADPKIHIKGFHGNIFSKFKSLTAYLRQQGIGIVFSYLTAANMIAALACRRAGAKAVIGLRNAQLPLAKRIADRYVTNRLACKAISNSYAGKDVFSRQGVSEDKIEVIPNCYEKFSEGIHNKEHSAPNIITVGRFVPQKDYLTAIRAIAELKRLTPSFTFTIVGYGEQEKQVRKWIQEYGIDDVTTIYINPDNIAQLLQSADIYLSTSLFEGTSNSIMEAMDAELPVVCTCVGDNDRLVSDEANGYLVPIKDAKAIAKKLKLLISEPQNRHLMGQKSKEKLMAEYSQDIFTARYLQFIKSITD